MISNNNKILLEQHIRELKQKFKSFEHKLRDEKDIVKGALPFSTTYNGETIDDEYEIELLIPEEYPDLPPTAKEVGKKIPDDFHRNKDAENTLCLGSPIAVLKKLREKPTLLHFVEQQVVPFLFSHSFYKKHNKMPYGDLSHGGEGILEYYKSYFNVQNDLAIVGLLRVLVDNDYRGHHLCPCGSNEKVKKCHGDLLLELVNNYPSETFLYEYQQILNHFIKNNIKIPKDYLSNKLAKEFKKKKNAKK